MERGLKARAIVAVAAVEWNPASSRERLGNTGENPDDVEWNLGVVAEPETVVVELDDNVVVVEAFVVEFEHNNHSVPRFLSLVSDRSPPPRSLSLFSIHFLLSIVIFGFEENGVLRVSHCGLLPFVL